MDTALLWTVDCGLWTVNCVHSKFKSKKNILQNVYLPKCLSDSQICLFLYPVRMANDSKKRYNNFVLDKDGIFDILIIIL